MATEEPPFDPNATGFIVRTDAGARKIIDRIDQLRDDFGELHGELGKVKEASVRWDRLLFILGSAATVIVGAAWKVTTNSVERGDKWMATQVNQLRGEMSELRKGAAYAKGSYDVQVEKRPAAAVAKEVQAATSDAGTR